MSDLAAAAAAPTPAAPVPPSALPPAPSAVPPIGAGDDSVTRRFLTQRSQDLQPNFAGLDALAASNRPGAAPAPSAAGTPPAPDPTRPISLRATVDAVTGALGKTGLPGLWNTVGDVTKALPELPSQVIGGTADAFNNVMKFADDVTRHVEAAGVPNVYVQLFDKNGSLAPRMLSADEFRAEQAAGTNQVFQIPTTAGPQSVTGSIVRTATPFLIGRTPFLQGATDLGMTGIAREATADLGSGATFVDPTQSRLSNALDAVAPNAVSSFLKADPADEGTLLGHLKASLEYAGLGAAFNGVVGLLRSLKAGGGGADAATAPNAAATDASAAPATATTDTGAAPPAGGIGTAPPTPAPTLPPDAALAGATPSGAAAAPASTIAADGVRPPTITAPAPDFLPIGDKAAPAVEISPEIQSQAQAYLAGESGDNPIKVNLARIGSGQDIADALAQVSSMIPAQAVQSNTATIAAADALGLTAEDFLAGYKGQNLDASQTTAMRFMLDSSAGQLIDYAKAARDPNTGSPAAQASFLKAFATHRALQSYFENARAEAGRTLQAWSIMSQTRSDQGKMIDQLLANAGDDPAELAGKIADLDDPLAASKYVAAASKMDGRQKLLFAYYNLLLSDPRTVVKKIASDTGVALWEAAARTIAGQLPALGLSTPGTGLNAAVDPAEGAALGYGYMASLRNSLRLAGRGLATGESTFETTSAGLPKLSASGIADDGLNVEEPGANMAAYLKSALPTHWIGAADDFAKWQGYQAQLNALAFRQGRQLGLTGDDLEQHIAGVLDTVPPDLHEQAYEYALRTTFQDPLAGFAQKLSQAADQMNVPIMNTGFSFPLGRVLVPFVKVPTNIARFAYTNSALPLLSPSSAVRAQIEAGGASRDLAMARIAMGSSVSLAGIGLALSGLLTGRGPSEPGLHQAWLDAGNTPYSLKIGGTSYGYNQVEPLGLTLGAIADTADAMKFARDTTAEQTAFSLAAGVGNAMLSKTYLSGIASVFQAMQDPERNAQGWGEQFLTSVIPRGAAAIERASDPWLRTHYGLLDKIYSEIPGLAQGLPVQRTVWGDPIPAKGAFSPVPGTSDTFGARLLSPVPTAPAGNVQPIDQFLWDQRTPVERVSPVQEYSAGPVKAQVDLRQFDPRLYDRLQVLAGNGLKDPQTGLGARDTLNSLVDGTNPDAGRQAAWTNAGSDDMRALMAKAEILRYRTAARQQLLQESPALRNAVQGQLAAKAQAIGAPGQ